MILDLEWNSRDSIVLISLSFFFGMTTSQSIHYFDTATGNIYIIYHMIMSRQIIS